MWVGDMMLSLRSSSPSLLVQSHLLQILNDTLLELLLLLGGVRVVEPNDQPPLVPPGVIIVQKNSLGVANMKVSTRLRREASTNLKGNGTLEGVATHDERVEDILGGELGLAIN